jgi:hypothetical protein
MPQSERIQHGLGRVCANVRAYKAGDPMRMPRHSSPAFT